MKKCPNCQKTFEDEKRFCQVDGTPLVEMIDPPPVEDPFKTVVVGKQDIPSISEDPMKTTVISADAKDEDILQIPEVFDPLKTVVVSQPISIDKPADPPVVEETSFTAPELPKFEVPEIKPPSFGDLSANEHPKMEEPKVEPSPIEPPKFDTPIASPFNEAPKIDTPIASPFNAPSPKAETSKTDQPPVKSSPFEMPKSEPIPSPFEMPKSEPAQMNEPFQPTPFNEPPPTFNPPPTPFGQNPSVQNDWNPPPINQSLSEPNPATPVIAGSEGQNKTLGVVSLILGIASFICFLSLLGSIPAVITGYMQKGRIKSNPSEYGGGGFATIGMVLGVINIILSIIGIIFYALLIFQVISF